MEQPLERRLVPVTVEPAQDPDGRMRVLLQLPDGFVLVSPQGALLIAAQLIDTAIDIINES